MLKMHHPKLCGAVSGPSVASPVKTASNRNTHASSCQQYVSRSFINNSTANMNNAIKRNNPLRSSVDATQTNRNGMKNSNVLTNSTNMIRSNPNIELNTNKNANMSTQTNVSLSSTDYENARLSLNKNKSDTSSSVGKVSKSVTLNETEFNELLRSVQEEYTNLVL
jgi:hypothetical protein